MNSAVLGIAQISQVGLRLELVADRHEAAEHLGIAQISQVGLRLGNCASVRHHVVVPRNRPDQSGGIATLPPTWTHVALLISRNRPDQSGGIATFFVLASASFVLASSESPRSVRWDCD